MLEEGWRDECLGRRSPVAFWARALSEPLRNAFVQRFGNNDIRARCRGIGGVARHSHPPGRSLATRIKTAMGNLAQDVKFAFRMMWSARGFSAAVIGTLALGIGANAAIFSVLNAVVLSPLPYPEPERLVHVWTQFPLQDIDRFEVSAAEFSDYKAESELFEAMFAYRLSTRVVTGGDRPIRISAAVASADIWSVLGGQAAIGRTFGHEEDRPGVSPVAVLDYGFWQQTLGGDRSIVGESLLLNGVPYEVVGVMPAGFRMTGTRVDLWIPLAIDTENLTVRTGHGLSVIGRTVPETSLGAVRAEMQVVSDRWRDLYEHAHPLTATGVQEHVVGDARRHLSVLMVAVGFVLLIACANVAGLLMARTTGRQREISVRAALGAQRSRLVGQILTEAVLLSLCGGMLGLVAAGVGTRLLLQVEPGNLPRIGEIGTDANVLAFVLLTSVATGLCFASVPAWRAARTGANIALQTSTRSTSGAQRYHFHRLMVIAEVAIAVVLVVGAGLLVRSLGSLTRVDPGLDPSNLIASRVSLPFSTYTSSAQSMAFWERLRRELRGLPGFADAALVRALPMRDEVCMEVFLRQGETLQSANQSGHVPSFDYQLSFPGYFHTAGIPLTAGRDFTAADRPGASRVAIVTESLARRYFPDRTPVGERIRILASNPNDVPFEIIGVAGDVRHEGLGADAPVQIYVPYAQAAEYRPGLTWTAAIVVRTELDAEAAIGSLRRTIRALDPDLHVADASTMSSLMRDSVARPRFTTLLLSLFSALALALACIGIYAIVAYSVAQRTREMGIRIALGAEHRRIIALVLRVGMTPAAIGIAIGIVGALAMSRLLSSLLFGGTPTDPLTYLMVTAILAGSALVASWVPAHRATRVDPRESLRAE